MGAVAVGDKASESTDATTADAGAPSQTTSTTEAGRSSSSSSRLAGTGKAVRAGSDHFRNRIAWVVWLSAVLAAVVLAMGALLIALDASQKNVIVEAVLNLANKIDGPFWKVFDFYRENKQGARTGPDSVKNHLVNWGLAAVAYLIGGRITDQVIRP